MNHLAIHLSLLPATKGNAFKIQSLSNKRCLAFRSPWVREKSYVPSLTLTNCQQNSTAYAMLWKWTRARELKLKGKQRCLTASRHGVVFLQRCGVLNHDQFQQWKCNGNLLELKNMRKYLVPFKFSTDLGTLFGVIMRLVSTKERKSQSDSMVVYGDGEWTQYSRGVSLCDNLSI